jgi:HTH-type transcriptional regulator, sugar sensing transcriptional regulator
MTAAVEQLQQLGFSQYEAQAYLALLKKNPVSGYELARDSGIPRPNVYPVLQKLEERGAVLRLDTPEGARYSPVPPDDLLGSLKQQYQKTLEAASGALCDLDAPQALEYVLNLRGYPALLDHAQTVLSHAQKHLLLSIWPEEAAALAEPVRQAQERGVQITTLCLRGCPRPCPACQGTVFRHPIAPAQGGRWLVLVADDEELLAGEISTPENTLAVRTRQAMLVSLTGSYIQNSIALACILSGLGSRLDDALGPETTAALNALHPLRSTQQGRWLEVMRKMIQPTS